MVTRLLVCLLALGLGSSLHAEHAPTTKLLPDSTLVYVNVPDTHLLVERLQQTAGAKMIQDPQMKPLAEQLYSSLTGLIPQVEQRLGLTVDDILRLPQGEVTLAFIVPEGLPPAVVALVDTGDQRFNMQKLIERGEEAMENDGAVRSEETIDDVKIVVYENTRNRQIMYFEKEGTYVFGTQMEVLKDILKAWSEGQEESLAGKQNFAAVMQRCRGGEGHEPQFKWFVDPIVLAERLSDAGGSGALVSALIQSQGLDAIRGLGGTVTMAVEEYDVLIHTHFLIDNPRTGILEILALVPGDAKPEKWVPKEVSSYTTVHFDFPTIYEQVGLVVDSFQGEGAFKNRVQRGFDNLDLNFEEEILPLLAGRVSLFNWHQPPARLFSDSNLLGIQLDDAKSAKVVLDKVREQFADRVEEKFFGGVSCYIVTPPERADREERPFRPRPTFCILDDYLLVSERPETVEKAILTANDSSAGLRNSLEYKLIAGKIQREAGTTTPALVTFNRPEEDVKFLYDLLRSSEVRENARSRFGENQVFQTVERALDENPLPAFQVLQQYLAPGGAMVTDDETGFHYMGFALRRQQE